MSEGTSRPNRPTHGLVFESGRRQRTAEGSVALELLPAPSPVDCFRQLASQRHCLFLESASQNSTLGKFSFLAVDPFDWSETPVGSADPLNRLSDQLQEYSATPIAGLPPFQGGGRRTVVL